MDKEGVRTLNGRADGSLSAKGRVFLEHSGWSTGAEGDCQLPRAGDKGPKHRLVV